jgi:amino acid adenylation domain-containing protein
LFQVWFAWQDDLDGGLELPGLRSTPTAVREHRIAKFDLRLSLEERGGRIVGGLEYATALFERATVERYIGYLRELLAGMVAREGEAVERLPLLGERERRWIDEWNATETEHPRDKCVHELFEEQVENTPDAVALRFEETALSYAELNRRANSLARRLRELGVGPDERVGVCLERSPEMVVALLGTMKAGGAYVPLDPVYPGERLQYMLEDSAPAVLLTRNHLHASIPGLPEGLTVLDASDFKAWEKLAETNLDHKESGVRHDNLVYLIYTSGSTGKPKAVMIEHRQVSNYLTWCRDSYYRQSGYGSPAVFSVGFDASVTTFFGAILSGQTLELLPSGAEMESIARRCSTHDPAYSLIKLTPSHLKMLNQMIPLGCKSAPTEALMMGGEALTPSDVYFWQERFPDVRIINHFGPTETTVGCCTFDVLTSVAGLSSIPIGRPISNARLYILDPLGELAPIGVSGELYVGGAGVGRGYFQRPELTAERFVLDPYAAKVGGRMYRTGDLAKRLSDGTVAYLGRNDSQVKIRGFRVELGEIEACLAAHGAVQDAVVTAADGNGGEKRLVAYYTRRKGTDAKDTAAEADELRRHLRERLPDYMGPSAYVPLEKLPLTPNGKLDRKALPAAQTTASSEDHYEAPVGEMETLVAATWAELLKLERVGRRQDFFELGGHSLLAVTVIMQFQQNLKVDVTISDLFEYPTVCSFADRLVNRKLEQFGAENLNDLVDLMQA